MTRTASYPPDQDTDEQTALYANSGDTLAEARLRKLLVRVFATTPAFVDQPASEYPHLAADTAMRIVGPVLEEVAEHARREFTTAVRVAADTRLAQRLKVIEAAVRASERAACVQQLHATGHAPAAAALGAASPSVAAQKRPVE